MNPKAFPRYFLEYFDPFLSWTRSPRQHFGYWDVKDANRQMRILAYNEIGTLFRIVSNDGKWHSLPFAIVKREK